MRRIVLSVLREAGIESAFGGGRNDRSEREWSPGDRWRCFSMAARAPTSLIGVMLEDWIVMLSITGGCSGRVIRKCNSMGLCADVRVGGVTIRCMYFLWAVRVVYS